MLLGDGMRTRTVMALLGAVVALGIGLDLAGGASERYPRPDLVDATVTVCSPPACAGMCPEALAKASRRASAPGAHRPHRRLSWHCRSPRTKRKPVPHRTVECRPGSQASCAQRPSPAGHAPTPGRSRARRG
jgi:hypothetical protein